MSASSTKWNSGVARCHDSAKIDYTDKDRHHTVRDPGEKDEQRREWSKFASLSNAEIQN